MIFQGEEPAGLKQYPTRARAYGPTELSLQRLPLREHTPVKGHTSQPRQLGPGQASPGKAEKAASSEVPSQARKGPMSYQDMMQAANRNAERVERVNSSAAPGKWKQANPHKGIIDALTASVKTSSVKPASIKPPVLRRKVRKNFATLPPAMYSV